MTGLYSLASIEKLQQRYIDKGGEYVVLEEGSLLDGLAVLHGDGLKTAVIKEVYLNSQSSAYSIRFYNSTPKKYQLLLDLVLINNLLG